MYQSVHNIPGCLDIGLGVLLQTSMEMFVTVIGSFSAAHPSFPLTRLREESSGTSFVNTHPGRLSAKSLAAIKAHVDTSADPRTGP